MKSPWSAFLAIALALVAGTACSGKKKKVVPLGSNQMVASEHGVDYLDEHYRFTIRLDQKWKLLSADERAQILPDAAAAVGRMGGTYGAVIVEPTAADKLEDYADLIFSHAEERIVGAKMGEIRKVEFAGRPAIRRKVTGTVNSIDVTFEYLMFIHQDMAYQVLAWQSKSGADAAEMENFFGAVGIAEGKVTIPPPPEVANSTGVGSRVFKQRFESVLSGLSVVQSGPWGLLAGQSLVDANDDAETGLYRPDQGIYITLSFEPVDASAEKRFLGSVRALITEEAVEEEEITFTVGGEPVKCLRVLVPGATPLRYHSGHFVRGGIGYRLTAWHYDKRGENQQDSIQEGLTRVSFMDAAAKSRLRGELLALPDSQGSAGPEFSLRAGTYRDFAAGVTWKKPAGFWKIMTGDEARSHNESSSLYAKELETGLNMMLIAESEPVEDEEAYHELLVKNLVASGFKETGEKLPEFRVDGRLLRRSRLHVKGDDIDLSYDLATVVANGKAYQLNAFATPAVLAKRPGLIEDCLSGFAFPGSKLEPTTQEPGNRFKDTRMGFQLSLPGSGWKIEKKKHPVVSKLGSMVQYEGKDRLLIHMAMDTVMGGQDSAIGARMISEMFRVNLDRSDSKGVTSRGTTVAGVTATVQEGRSEGKEVRVIVFRSGSVVHMGMLLGESKQGVEDLLSDYIAGFTFVP